MYNLRMAATFWNKLPYKGLVVAGLALNLAIVLLFLIVKSFLPPIVPLLYGRPIGSGQLLPDMGILLAPALSVIFIVLNTIITGRVTDEFSKKLLITSAFLISLLTSITVLKIIFLVGFF